MNARYADAVPAHVPPHLVREYPIVQGRYIDEDPYQALIPELHTWPPVFYATNAYPGERPAWVIRREADLRAVYLDTEHFSSQGANPFAAAIGEQWNMIPTEIDPPDHTRYRALLNPLFSPNRMAQLEDKVRSIACRYIDDLKERGSCDLMLDLAFPFPVTVFLDLIDLPHEETPTFMQWEHDLLHEGDIDVVAAAVRNVTGYLRDVIAQRRRRPGADLISFGIQAEVDGRRLNDDELIGYAFNLFIGGLDTVSTNMGLHFRYLAEHPQQQAQLRDHPEMIPAALQELLRAFGATSTFRTCIKERVIGGVTIKPGDRVLVSTILACRDPEAYDQPNEIRFDRNPRQIITFGSGAHLCIGMHLARRELRIALEEFLGRVPFFHLQAGATIRTHLGGMVQPTTLPLVWS